MRFNSAMASTQLATCELLTSLSLSHSLLRHVARDILLGLSAILACFPFASVALAQRTRFGCILRVSQDDLLSVRAHCLRCLLRDGTKVANVTLFFVVLRRERAMHPAIFTKCARAPIDLLLFLN